MIRRILFVDFCCRSLHGRKENVLRVDVVRRWLQMDLGFHMFWRDSIPNSVMSSMLGDLAGSGSVKFKYSTLFAVLWLVAGADLL